MKLSTRARYALRAMMVIARNTEEGELLNLAEVARQTGISHRYLEQVAISLKNAKLLKAVAGKHGGHLLTRPPAQITLTEIVTAAIGEINVVDCVKEPETCAKFEGCECRSLYTEINDAIVKTLDQYTLADLAAGKIDGCC